MFRPRLLEIGAALWFVPIAIAVGLGQQSKPGVTKQNPDLESVVARMENAMEAKRMQTPAYVLIRDYRLYGGKEQDPKSEVVAEINFVPPSEKTFKIDTVQGNERGRTVVQNLLSNESEVTRNNSPAIINRQNYNFTWGGEGVLDGHTCWILHVQPKREEKELVRGDVWVDKDTYLVRQVEGELAKSPSWWIRRVHVIVGFDEVNGMWLQTGTRAIADVRLVGRYTLIAQAVDLQSSEQQVASASPQSTQNPHRSPNHIRRTPVLGTSVLTAH